MANRIRTIDFLPEIFRTETNKQFLSSTLDQLVQDPKLRSTQGYIGRRSGPGVNPNDQYVIEPTAERTNYQFEPSLVFLENDKNTVTDVLTYPGYIDRLRLKGANVNRHDRLFNSEYYSWDPFVDIDKFVNFGQYYWLPDGPNSVDVFSTAIPTTDNFTVTRTSTGYTFSDVVGTLPTITLARTGSYTFDVNQTGNPFWIQTTPGTDGTLAFNDQSSREVLGVVNNGDDNGTITFNVPDRTAQNFFLELTSAGTADLVTDLKLNQIHNVLLSSFIDEHGGIDGITDLDDRTVIFTNRIDDADDGGWLQSTQFDNVQGFDGEEFDKTRSITDKAEKYGIWKITYVYDSNGQNPIMSLSNINTVADQTKLNINYGTLYSNTQFWKTSEGYFEKIPLLTASADTLYYQDGTNNNLFGVIKLIDIENADVLNINDILGTVNYTSPNGVVFTNGLKVQFEGRVTPESYAGNEYYIEGVGTSIQLLPITDFVTPEDYAESLTTPFDTLGYDEGGWDGSENAPINKDYMVINRASPDLNAWSRNNRWFHIDVISATAKYNNTALVIDNTARATRPILEFRAGLRLYNSGTQAIAPVDVIDTRELDAFSNINGATGYSVDSVALEEGTRIIFAADTDPAVRNKVYTVTFVEFDDSSEAVISLQAPNIEHPSITVDSSVLITSGVVNGGKTFYYNGTSWIEAQQKVELNQAPLFDLFDNNGYSFSDTTVYPSSTFTGNKLFGYGVGTGVDDIVIGQPLKYLNINNIGDIVFENYLNTETFTFVNGLGAGEILKVNTGYAREYTNRTTYTTLLGWQTSSNQTVSVQSFSFDYTGTDLILDVASSSASNAVKVFVDGVFLLPENYTYATNSNGVTQITFVNAPALNSAVEVTVHSETPSQIGYYTVPSNLENNSTNTNETELTLGTIRNHYNTICQNINNFAGKINGANNLRDLGNTIPYGRTVLQQSSPLTMLGTFLNDSRFDLFNALDFSANEYEKFKNRLLDEAIRSDWTGYTTNQIFDNTLETLNAGKNQYSPFYWADTIPSGKTYEETSYTISTITTDTFDTLYSYDFTKASYAGILVYLNDEILLGDAHEYTVATDGPRIVIDTTKVTLNVGDVLKIREYTQTYGNFIPPTPASLGLAPVWEPELFVDDTYVTPTNVIRGHDGSITVAYGDFRDNLLLEFEKRVYNNIKTDNRYVTPLEVVEVMPGASRITEYSLAEINEILGKDFLRWVGTNRLPYHEQTYDANNPFTWNYSQSTSKTNGEVLLGGWRAIYRRYYDTDRPHTHPWEMLGFTEKPSWWENKYGVAPYTSGNLVLWEDLRDGVIADPNNPTTSTQYARPDLLSIIPADSEGNLLAPRDTVVGNYDSNSFKKSWVLGDEGPVETAWRRSSHYRFALQRLLALTKPAKYFSLFADRISYKYNTTYSQFLVNNRSRLQPSTVAVYGNGTSTNSYMNWIVDYNRLLGVDSTSLLKERLSNLDVRLSYRLAGFSDKQYLKIFSEKSSPNSLNNSLLIPDESFQLMLYKNPAFEELSYSSVIIQQSDNGYTVSGYSTLNPFFEILSSIPNGRYSTFNINGEDYRVASDFRNKVVRVPYGYTFTSKSSVVDFLVSYGKFLEQRGMTFDSIEQNVLIDWKQMAQEFIYWADANWVTGSIINFNPGANIIKITKENAVAESLIAPGLENIVLDQNKSAINSTDYVVERIDNSLTLRALTNNNFNLLNTRFTAYEHIIVLDNTSIFNDLIYNPATGARQGRLSLNGYKTFDWNGTLDAQGFILNQDNVQAWQPNQSYSKGEIVLYKNAYWSASDIIPPSAEFDFAVWIKSDYDKIQKGLLPNLATKADLIRDNYSSNSANLERDGDLLGFGLIGFRPRQYMQNLNLDDISQVNLYKQFLGTKGTLQSAEIFSLANLNKEVAEYNITENWAIKRASYGATTNRQFVELNLREEDLRANPSTVSVIDTNGQSTSSANQSILIDDIWKESVKITNTNILPTFTLGKPDRVLPDAGYVNYDDVDIKVFDFNDLSEIVNNFDIVAAGTNIWVAKSNTYDWNVYRADLVSSRVVQVTDNLNGTCTLTFNKNHNLTVGNKLIVKYFDSTVDGAYEIARVTGLKTVVVELSLTGETTSIVGTGIGLVLSSVKVAQSSDINNLNIANTIVPGSRVWSDDNGTGKWAVHKKIDPFDFKYHLEPDVVETNMLYGTTVAIGVRGFGGLVGAPGYDSGAGGIYTYNRSGETGCEQTSLLAPDTTGLVGLGTSLAVGGEEYAVTGAPDSDSSRGYAYVINRSPQTGQYIITQCLTTETSTGGQFGYSVAISDDERWMYVGAPGDDKVYAYNKFEALSQRIDFVGDGSTNQFDISSLIKVDEDSTEDDSIGKHQLSVLLNNRQLDDADWAYGDGVITFTTTPNENDAIRVTRKQSLFVEATNLSELQLNEVYSIVSANSIYAFAVFLDDTPLRPFIDYTYNTNTNILSFDPTVYPTGVSGNLLIRADSYYKLVKSFTYFEITGDAKDHNTAFGYSIATTTDGRQLMVGAPNDTVNGLDNAGTVVAIDRSVLKYQIQTSDHDGEFTGFTSTDSTELVNGTPAVKLNGTFLVLDDGTNFGGEYTWDGSTIAISVELSVGDIVEIETNEFNMFQRIEPQLPETNLNFGTTLEQCSTNCSLYIGNINDSTVVTGSGSVDWWLNNARVYGATTTVVANPSVTVGHSIRINNYEVVLTGTSVAETVNDINNADLPNISASSSNGYLTITLVDVAAGDVFTKLQVMPGAGSAYYDLGFQVLGHTQTIRPPVESEHGHFGSAIFNEINNGVNTLIVGAPDAKAIRATTFDTNTTLLDGGSTNIQKTLERTGVVYTYDYLSSANTTVNNPSKFVFGQQIYNLDINGLDRFGASVSYCNGLLMIGTPQDDLGDSVGNFGQASMYYNSTMGSAWSTEYEQQDIVDVELLNSVFFYNKNGNQIIDYVDYIDPIQGKILGVARQNIDFISGLDPAQYNAGNTNNNGQFWRDIHVGEIWWDTSTVRFIDYHQDNLLYKAQRWGQQFPGSSIDIYQWIESDVPPASYTGIGTVYNPESYVIQSTLDTTGVFISKYYFWVKGINTITTSKNKTLSTTAIAQYIENPRSSGVSYVAMLGTSDIALYNCRNKIIANDSVIHVEYDKEKNQDNVHVEYDLVGAGQAESFLSDNLYRKLLDSFSGNDTLGNPVPDVALSVANKYGVQFRPRQSMFKDRFVALKNYLTRANTILALYPIAESKSFALLNSKETMPNSASGQWDKSLNTYAELTYQNLDLVDAGYRYLIVSDETQDGLWTMYTVQSDGSLLLSRVQTYDTSNYWSYIDWVRPGYNTAIKPVAEVTTQSNLQTITNVREGDSVKVTANSFGKYEIYQYLAGEWIRVVAENSTIAISSVVWDLTVGSYGFGAEVFDNQRFDQNPSTETRQIIRALNEEIFAGDLLIHRNELLTLVFEYILTESLAPDWLIKTSLIDVDHKIRDLEPFAVYRRDNQDFVQQYIDEVKPYHVKIKEFKLRYEGLDTFQGTLSDFDVPAYYNNTYSKFISPVLDDTEYDTVTTALESHVPSRDPIWQTLPYSQWYNNYKLAVGSVTVTNGGSGYTVPPTVTVTGTATTTASLVARINTAGAVIAIDVLDGGEGYTTTPTIVIEGGNGTGAKAIAVTTQRLARSFNTTLKFDRYQYSTSVVTWAANTFYEPGDLVRYNNKLYTAAVLDDSSAIITDTFEPSYFVEVDQSTLTGVDRIIGLYQPDIQDPGRELQQLITGIDYPGVQVKGPNFNEDPGFDVGNFDVAPFGDPAPGDLPAGSSRISETYLDAIYESSFTDTYLGTRSTDVNVTGGEFIDVYSSHAPEELVPGSMFDTLQITVTQLEREFNPDYSTDSPVALQFRIFEDMRANQKIYRIIDSNTTTLTADLATTDDIIYVDDASKLPEPDLSNGVFGVIAINGERILYRTRNTSNNTVSGLRRGVSGTAISSHSDGDSVYSSSTSDQLPIDYQKAADSYKFLFTGDGSTDTFIGTGVSVGTSLDSTEIEEAVQVKVGGRLLDNTEYTVTQLQPVVEIILDDPIEENVTIEIEIFIETAVWMYDVDQDGSTLDGLEYQSTDAARFIRGEI